MTYNVLMGTLNSFSIYSLDCWRLFPVDFSFQCFDSALKGKVYRKQTLTVFYWHCWLGDRKAIWPVKQTGCSFVGGDDFELCTSYSSSCDHHHRRSTVILSSNIIQHADVLVPDNPRWSGKWLQNLHINTHTRARARTHIHSIMTKLITGMVK